jgi:predicted Zn-ribbon and HTH transcriptional regulator
VLTIDQRTRALIRQAEKVERDSKRHLANAEAQLMRLTRCARCGFKFGAHDEIDGRCPNPDGTL